MYGESESVSMAVAKIANEGWRSACGESWRNLGAQQHGVMKA